MIDLELVRNEPERVKQGIASKGANPGLVDDLLELDNEWRRLTSELDNLRAAQNRLSRERTVEEAKQNKEAIKVKEIERAEVARQRTLVWEQIPNLPSDDTPVGRGEEENKVLRTWGEPPRFDFEPKDHVALGEALDLIDIEHAGKVAGTRFGYLKGDAVLMEFGLVQIAFSVLRDESLLRRIADSVLPGYSNKPFVPVVPPQMIKPDVFQKMARLEPQEERYFIPSDKLFLIGSAEHTLGPLHMDEILREDELPKRYIGFSTSFRREAGSYGKDTRGILRVHQFDKLEMESFTLPDDSVREQDFIVAVQEYLVQMLKLPYRVVAICTGDMSGPDARQIDIETWMPGQARYRETHTADLMTDYQARRLNIRYLAKGRGPRAKTSFVHMNDATAFAIGRTLIAIIENYQTKDGRVRVPEVLQPYVGKDIIS